MTAANVQKTIVNILEHAHIAMGRAVHIAITVAIAIAWIA
jgi:hypothetical protein